SQVPSVGRIQRSGSKVGGARSRYCRRIRHRRLDALLVLAGERAAVPPATPGRLAEGPESAEAEVRLDVGEPRLLERLARTDAWRKAGHHLTAKAFRRRLLESGRLLHRALF